MLDLFKRLFCKKHLEGETAPSLSERNTTNHTSEPSEDSITENAKLCAKPVSKTPSHPLNKKTKHVYHDLSNSRGSSRTSSVLSCTHSTDYVILDTETTGLNPHTDQIIQLSAIRYNANGMPTGFFNTFLNPGCHIPPHITEINGITDKMVSNAPYASQTQESFLSFLDNALIIGYNVTFDLRFLNQTFRGAFSGQNYVDALSLSRRMLYLSSYKLNMVSYEIGFRPSGEFHDSFTDCEAVAAILRHINTDLSPWISTFKVSKGRSPSYPRTVKYEPGLALWEKGESFRKNGSLESALLFFNRARDAGYTSPSLYESYAMLYRKMGDFESEISILEEGICRYPGGPVKDSFMERKMKAQERLSAHLQKEKILREKEEERIRRAEERRLRKEVETAKPKQTSRRPVLQCSDDGTVLCEFPSLSDASKAVGISTKCIRDCANGRQKHAGGYCWKFQTIRISKPPESENSRT